MRLIDADEMILDLQHRCSNETFYKQVKESLIDCSPTVEAVSKGLFDQIKWERDIAISELEELGLSLGQKIDGVYLTKEEHKKLLEYKYMYEDLCQ